LAWTELPDDISENTNLEEYLADLNVDVHYVKTDIKGNEVYFAPYHTLPIGYENKKFAVSVKFCNLKMCTKWSKPLFVTYPAYESGDPIVCYDKHFRSMPDVLQPWNTVTQPNNIDMRIELPSQMR